MKPQKFRKVTIGKGENAREEYLSASVVDAMEQSSAETAEGKKKEIARNMDRMGITEIHKGEFMQKAKDLDENKVMEFVPYSETTAKTVTKAPATDAVKLATDGEKKAKKDKAPKTDANPNAGANTGAGTGTPPAPGTDDAGGAGSDDAK